MLSPLVHIICKIVYFFFTPKFKSYNTNNPINLLQNATSPHSHWQRWHSARRTGGRPMCSTTTIRVYWHWVFLLTDFQLDKRVIFRNPWVSDKIPLPICFSCDCWGCRLMMAFVLGRLPTISSAFRAFVCFRFWLYLYHSIMLWTCV